MEKEELIVNWINNDIKELLKRVPPFIQHTFTESGFLMLYSSVAFQMILHELNLDPECVKEIMEDHTESIGHMAQHLAEIEGGKIDFKVFNKVPRKENLN